MEQQASRAGRPCLQYGQSLQSLPHARRVVRRLQVEATNSRSRSGSTGPPRLLRSPPNALNDAFCGCHLCAPRLQVEATKFTEVGFHGRDVDQIIRDLVDNAIIMMRQVGGEGPSAGVTAAAPASRASGGGCCRSSCSSRRPPAAVAAAPAAAGTHPGPARPPGLHLSPRRAVHTAVLPLLPPQPLPVVRPPPPLLQRLRKDMKRAIDEAVEERILTALCGETASQDTKNSFRDLYRWVGGRQFGGRVGAADACFVLLSAPPWQHRHGSIGEAPCRR